ncbi:carboxylating nicotinate-nucleotide diphosphorylase [Salinispira pacifica]|uniref:nicotinate-nucleotide diphosphorylase (carboxylating) n=1 Tax=Salinispira pacifica TaxID=1307761 RepID=V5WG74_9SPIO|nr:carboxylating nicotinate-nucleotide diphosphorylase [Salinispira pacifica]AHC14842.1 Quinolinate phosphoribosyltransferase (decarboxylating) [Salinispira pacifica]
MDLANGELYEEFSLLLKHALQEDLGDLGDITSDAVFSSGDMSRAVIISRQDGVLSGLDCAIETFRSCDPDKALSFAPAAVDGDLLEDGQKVLEISGPAGSLLRAERSALNFLGFFSGIAGNAKRHCDALEGSSTRILDTRKTLPGYRRLSKAAVADGGGFNHRMGLYDMVMIKDNHADAAGGLAAAVQKVHEKWGEQFKVEVECRNLEQVALALTLDVDVIMLDNMSREDCREAVRLREEKGRTAQAFEASGDFTPEKIREYADVGLDFISVGGLTHSVKNHNFSMRIVH